MLLNTALHTSHRNRMFGPLWFSFSWFPTSSEDCVWSDWVVPVMYWWSDVILPPRVFFSTITRGFTCVPGVATAFFCQTKDNTYWFIHYLLSASFNILLKLMYSHVQGCNRLVKRSWIFVYVFKIMKQVERYCSRYH